MSCQIPLSIQEALETMQSCFYPLPNRAYSSFAKAEAAAAFLGGLIADLDLFVERRGNTFLNCVQRQINQFASFFDAEFKPARPFPTLVSQQLMTGNRQYDALWFLVNQLGTTGDDKLTNAFKTICAYTVELHEQVQLLNFGNILQFLTLSKGFLGLFAQKSPSLAGYAESFLKRYLIGAETPKFDSRPSSALRSGSARSFSRLQSARPSSGFGPATPLKQVKKTAFFDWFAQYLDSSYRGSFVDEFLELAHRYEKSQFFQNTVSEVFVQKTHLTFPERLFITRDVSFNINGVVSQHFGADASGLENSVGFLALLAFVLNLVVQCQYYTGLLNVEQAMSYMRQQLLEQQIQEENGFLQEDLLFEAEAEPQNEDLCEEQLTLNLFKTEPRALDLQRLQELFLEKPFEFEYQAQTPLLAFVKDCQRSVQQSEYKFQLFMQQFSTPGDSVQLRQAVEEQLGERLKKTQLQQLAVERQSQDYRVLQQGVDLRVVSAFLKQIDFKFAENSLQPARVEHVTAAQAVNGLLCAFHIMSLKQAHSQVAEQPFDANSVLQQMDRFMQDLIQAPFGLSSYDTTRLLQKLQFQATEALAKTIELHKATYGDKFSQCSQSRLAALAARRQRAKAAYSSKNTFKLSEWIDDPQQNVLQCPAPLVGTLEATFELCATLRLNGLAFCDGNGLELESHVKTAEEALAMQHADVQVSGEQVIQIYFIQRPGLVDTRSKDVVRNAGYAIWKPEFAQRSDAEFVAESKRLEE